MLVYPIIVSRRDDGYHFAKAPDLPGVVVGAGTLAELLCEASDACAMWIVDAQDNNEPIPDATPATQIAAQADEFVSLVLVDTDRYRILNSNKPVKKTISIPESLAYAADKAGLSLSKVLKDALCSRLGLKYDS